MIIRNGNRPSERRACALQHRVTGAAAVLLAITAYACERPASHTVHIKNDDTVDLKVRIETSDGCCHWEKQVVASGSGIFEFRSDRDLVLHVTVASTDSGALERSGGYMSGFSASHEALYGTCVTISRQQIAIETCSH
jgi:hypothetical protein